MICSPKKFGEEGLLRILSWVAVVGLNRVFEEHKSDSVAKLCLDYVAT